MKRNFAVALFALLVVALAAFWGCQEKPTDASGLVEGAKPVTSSQTAQSIMVDLDHSSSNFIITGEAVYEYNKECATGYFTNSLISGPSISCTGGGQNNVNCQAGNQPATPAAPAPDPQKLNAAINSNACAFWNGTQLVIPPGQVTYTQSITIPGTNTKGNWKFEWTYAVAVGSIEIPTAGSCWDLQESTTEAAEVSISGIIAGLSVVKNNNIGRKTTFTLWDEATLSSRVKDVSYQIINNADQSVVASGDLPTTLYGAGGVDPTSLGYGSCLFTLPYTGNAGEWGTTSLLNGTTTSTTNGSSSFMGAILNDDDFANNNTDNGGCAHTAVAVFDGTTVSISETGSYTLRVSGIVKGNAGSLDYGFSTTSQLCITAGTCQVCPQNP